MSASAPQTARALRQLLPTSNIAAPAISPATPRAHLVLVPDSAEPVASADPQPQFVQSLAVVAFEIVEGLRSMSQLGSSVTLGAARQITNYRAARSEQRKVTGTAALTVQHIGRVRIDRSSPTIVEAAAVIHTNKRARAIAVRLEWEHARWRATDIVIL